ncbi:MAG: TlpA family protein disulfide reductase [Deltaproteobacteria bacterium]|nr:TlpA family protein disulfide reductase [Deltaproteobacteria bacterium]
MLRKSTLGLLVIMALMLSLTAPPAMGVVKEGDKLGDLDFPAPMTPEDAKYLGVTPGQPFKLSQIGAPYVLLEAFGTSCPHCFTQAPVLNTLYGLIQKDPKLAGKIKIIGLAAADSPANVDMWKQKFKVPFPLLPDPDLKVYNKLDVLGTPTTLLLDKSGTVLKAHAGVFQNPAAYLKELTAKMK